MCVCLNNLIHTSTEFAQCLFFLKQETHEVNMSQVNLLESIMSLLKVDLPLVKKRERETDDNVCVI